MELGDDVLKRIAQELVSVVRVNATVDWDKKEQVRASLRRHIRRLLTKHGYRHCCVGRSWRVGERRCLAGGQITMASSANASARRRPAGTSVPRS